MNSLDLLRGHLSNIGHGPIPEDQCDHVVQLLQECWHIVAPWPNGGMTADKLSTFRCENIEWLPPLLIFRIERHGALVAGNSTRSEVQYWQVDVEQGAAAFYVGEHRQLKPAEAQLDVHVLASQIATLVNSKAVDRRISWFADGDVKVNVSVIIPLTNKQTTLSRRRRFRLALEELLVGQGWQRREAGNSLIFALSTSPKSITHWATPQITSVAEPCEIANKRRARLLLICVETILTKLI